MQESLSVSGIMLGHTMGRSRSLSRLLRDRVRSKLSDLEIASNMAGRWRQSTIQIVMSSMPAVIYWVTGLTGRGDHMAISIGTLVAFTTLQQSLFRPAIQLLSTGVDIQSSLELFGRIFEYLDLPGRHRASRSTRRRWARCAARCAWTTSASATPAGRRRPCAAST